MNTRDTAIKAIADFLMERGWEEQTALNADYGQWKDPITGRTHDIDYAFTIELNRRERPKWETTLFSGTQKQH